MSNTRTTEAYKLYYENVLKDQHNNPDLIARWGSDPGRFETQVMTRKMGTKVPDSNMYEEDGETFGPSRWPYDAAGNPNYSDPPIKYMIGTRMKCIGSTWWDWKNKKTIGLGYDFDSIAGHAAGVGVSNEEIAALDKIDVPWLEVIRSTRGAGRHIYIWFEEDDAPVTENHTEHAALARAFIPLISQHTGLDINATVDVCGGVLWIHHENATKENQGYALIKPATQILTSAHVPPNWRDNLEVVSGVRSKVRVQGWDSDGLPTQGDELDSMTEAYAKQPLDEVHLRILEELERTGHSALWVHDHHLFQGHTVGLKQVFDDWADKGHPMKGLFDTNSPNTDVGKPNCFMRPKPDGGWDVYRFGDGTVECPLWGKQGKWTHTTYNFPPTLKQICMACGGFEGPDQNQGFLFSSVEELQAAMSLLGIEPIVPEKANGRTLALRARDSDGKTVLIISKSRGDSPSDFPRYAKTPKGWEKVLEEAIDTSDKEQEEDELWSELDEKFRALKIVHRAGSGGAFDSWVVRDASNDWTVHPRENVKSYLASFGYKQCDPILGGAIFKSWQIVNEPFHPEYPGGRVWNRNAAQLVYSPVDLAEGEMPYHPHWDKVMNHCGVDLDQYVPPLEWCKDWGIEIGGDYLTAWIACMLRYPFGKLPYLFMYGPQNSGKSTFHEAIALLMTRGVAKADRALTSAQGYNGELLDAVLAVVDEVDISKAGLQAYNKLKEWTTGMTISIHAKYKQVYETRSALHFVQMANTRSSLPVFSGDTRITAFNVPSLEEDIPKEKLFDHLRKEAPHFMRTLMDLEIPDALGRFMLPVIETQGKADAVVGNMSELERFLSDKCHSIPGAGITFKDFKERFISTLEDFQKSEWTETEIRRQLSEQFPIGRGRGNVMVIGNLSFVKCEPSEPYVLSGKRLVRESDNDG